jgi:tRNA dimethylallyltransferase
MNPHRDDLYSHLDARVITMIERGLVNEVKTLHKDYGDHLQAFQGIGYKEMILHLKGNLDLESTIQLIQQSTRRYAKRQFTYFRHQFPMTWYQDWQSAAKELLR